MSIVSGSEVLTHIAGISFSNVDGSSRRDYARALSVNREVVLVREPENIYDKNAVKIAVPVKHHRKGPAIKQLGYLPKGIAKIVAFHLDKGTHKVVNARMSGSLKRNAIKFNLALVDSTTEKVDPCMHYGMHHVNLMPGATCPECGAIEPNVLAKTKLSCTDFGLVHSFADASNACVFCGCLLGDDDGKKVDVDHTLLVEKARGYSKMIDACMHHIDPVSGTCLKCGARGPNVRTGGGRYA